MEEVKEIEALVRMYENKCIWDGKLLPDDIFTRNKIKYPYGMFCCKKCLEKFEKAVKNGYSNPLTTFFKNRINKNGK